MATNSLIQTDARQNRIQSFAFTIAAAVCILLAVGFVKSILSERRQSGEIALEEKISPNDASLGSLVRLPGIGLVRAEAIVAYRKNFSRQNGDRPAFQNGDDLQKVKGIGPKTVENIQEWLKFE